MGIGAAAASKHNERKTFDGVLSAGKSKVDKKAGRSSSAIPAAATEELSHEGSSSSSSKTPASGKRRHEGMLLERTRYKLYS